MNTPSRNVLVSGGSRGLGQAIVFELLTSGYCVSTFSRQPTPFIEEMSRSFPERFCFLLGDLSNPVQIRTIVQQATSRFGIPFGLINNAGIALDGVLATTAPCRIADLISINLCGTLYLTREVVRGMLLRNSGRIISISSIIGSRGYSGLSVYAASKAGIDGMTRSLARELGGRQITVNAVAPGYLETEMSHGLTPAQRAQIIRRTPLGRLGTPQDVTGLISFLLSDAAGFLSGQVIAVDGGLTC